jgi:hypothetical protein
MDYFVLKFSLAISDVNVELKTEASELSPSASPVSMM